MSRSIDVFFNDTATTEIYTLSLHDALPISAQPGVVRRLHLQQGVAVHQVEGAEALGRLPVAPDAAQPAVPQDRSEEHTSELQSRQYIVCRLLLEKKKLITPSTSHRNRRRRR